MAIVWPRPSPAIVPPENVIPATPYAPRTWLGASAFPGGEDEPSGEIGSRPGGTITRSAGAATPPALSSERASRGSNDRARESRLGSPEPLAERREAIVPGHAAQTQPSAAQGRRNPATTRVRPRAAGRSVGARHGRIPTAYA